MFCSACGTVNDDNAYKCIKCGKELVRVGSVAAVSIPNYLVQSILVTIFCCIWLGIPAIVFAAQVNGKAHSGDIAGATESSRKAKMWCWIAFGVGLAADILVAAFYAVGIAAGMSQLTKT